MVHVAPPPPCACLRQARKQGPYRPVLCSLIASPNNSTTSAGQGSGGSSSSCVAVHNVWDPASSTEPGNKGRVSRVGVMVARAHPHKCTPTQVPKFPLSDQNRRTLVYGTCS
eukprot:365771-Chlamydomonas_euryale.AAC.11